MIQSSAEPAMAAAGGVEIDGMHPADLGHGVSFRLRLSEILARRAQAVRLGQCLGMWRVTRKEGRGRAP